MIRRCKIGVLLLSGVVLFCQEQVEEGDIGKSGNGEMGSDSDTKSDSDEGGDSDTKSDSDEGGDSDTKSDSDEGGDSEMASDTPLDDWSCPAVMTASCEVDNINDGPAYEFTNDWAVDFGAGNISLVDADTSSGAILVQSVSGEFTAPAVLGILDSISGDIQEEGLAEPATEDMTAVGIATQNNLRFRKDSGFRAAQWIIGYPAVVLTCTDERCLLLGLATDEERVPQGLVPIPGGEVPAEESAGICAPDSERVCVAGRGVVCYDGIEWNESVPAEAGTFSAIDCATYGMHEMRKPVIVAAGKGGILWQGWNDGTWAEIETGSDIDFTAVNVDEGAIIAGGEGGIVFRNGDRLDTCDWADVNITAVLARPGNDAFTALDPNGNRYEIWKSRDGGANEICRGDSGIDSVPITADRDPGGADAYFSYVLTAGLLYSRVEFGIGP